MSKELSVYVHIPFCVRKCAYCDFLSFSSDEKTMERYIGALEEEICGCPYHTADYDVVSVFFGGGTPSVLPAACIDRLLAAVRKRFYVRKDAEITVEANPGTLTKEKLAVYREAGVNRLSIGAQSVHDKELKRLGRIHTAEQFAESFALARAAGFQNISVDLMSGLPYQRLGDWEATLRTVTAMRPEHISAYSLIIEEGTPFYERYHKEDELRAQGAETTVLPDEETERAMYAFTGAYLSKCGYRQYEISNYSLTGYESRHNIGYWIRRPYLGFGLGAASLFEDRRWSNVRSFHAYLSGASADEVEVLSREEIISETMFLGLRMNRGVVKKRFEQTAGCKMDELYGGQLAKLKRQGLLEETEDAVYLTKEGVNVSNYCMSAFLL